MRKRALVMLIAMVMAGTCFSNAARAQEKIKIGILGQFSGPFASIGKKYQQGIETYFAVHGTRAGGREVEVIYRDIGGANPSVAKQLAEELIIKEKVSLLGGFYTSPEPMAVAPVLTESKTPAVVFNGAALAITKTSPFIVRPANTMQQAGYVQAEWAIKNNHKRAYVLVSDFSPGHDLLNAFKTQFLKRGGTMVGEDKVPLNTVEFAPYVERLSNGKADLVNIFVPIGAPSVNVMKALRAQGMLGRKDVGIIGQGMIDDPYLELYDESIVGVRDVLVYAIDAAGEENAKFKEALVKKFGAGTIPSYEAACAYDGMRVLYKMIESQQGKRFDGTAAVQATLGYQFLGARGPTFIEPDTRSATMDVYVRVGAKGPDGKLRLNVDETYKAVKSDPLSQ